MRFWTKVLPELFYRGIVDQIYTTSQKSWATPHSLYFASSETNFHAIFLKWCWVIVLQASWKYFKVFLWTLASWTCSEEDLLVTYDFGITKAYSSRPTNNLTKNRHFVAKGQLQKHIACSHFFSNEKCKRWHIWQASLGIPAPTRLLPKRY